MLAVYQQRAMSQRAMPHSNLVSSGSDDSQEDSGGFALELQFVAALGGAFSESRYSIRKMKGLVKNLYQNGALALRIKQHCLELRAKDKTEINWEKVLNEFIEVIKGQSQLSPEVRFSEEELKVVITRLITANSDVLSTQQAFEEEKMKSREKEQTIAEKERALEEEKMKSREKEQTIAEKEQTIAEKERENEQLKRTIRELEQQQKRTSDDKKLYASPSSSTFASGSGFFSSHRSFLGKRSAEQMEEDERPKKKKKDERTGSFNPLSR